MVSARATDHLLANDLLGKLLTVWQRHCEEPRETALPTWTGYVRGVELTEGGTTLRVALELAEPHRDDWAGPCLPGDLVIVDNGYSANRTWNIFSLTRHPPILQTGRTDKAIQKRIDANDWQRAAGATICSRCELPYRDHTEVRGFPWLNILCDGSLVKL